MLVVCFINLPHFNRGLSSSGCGLISFLLFQVSEKLISDHNLVRRVSTTIALVKTVSLILNNINCLILK